MLDWTSGAQRIRQHTQGEIKTIMEEKKKGRPAKEETAGQTIGIRLTADIINQVDEITEEESKKTGYRLDRVNIIRRAITDFIQRYNQEREQ